MKQNKILALVLLFFAALLVSACTNGSALTGNSNWPGLTVEGDTVYTSNANFVEAIKDGQKLWNYPEPANNKLMFFAAPAVDEKYVYAGTYNNQLHVINKADGTFAASVEVGNNKNKIIAAPLAADGNVFVVSSGGMVSCYPTDITGGTLQPKWQLTLSNEIWVKPEYSGGTLYVASM
ncbi:MAG: PQQ-binding-like beta-propeller repeat protein, partial [Anaerolineaceae bacterium]|nr:PQQ-binding-like beta-propeller repeat protein [Anaerolineaceae bacterium]